MLRKLFIACDHAGFELKTQVLQHFSHNNSYVTKNFEIIDLGCMSTDSVDYPDYADVLCKEIQSELDLGILICGSGQGMSIRANKFSHIRAALVYNNEIAKLAREHNDANVITLGSRFCSLDNALTWIETFLKTEFAGGRHQQRVDKLKKST